MRIGFKFCLFLFTGILFTEVPQESLQAYSLPIATHIVVPKPPKFKYGDKSLLVSLESHIGNSLNQSDSIQEFLLRAVDQPLVLRDSNGLIHRSKEIKIIWRKVLLKNPILLSRQVSRPFPSFESASNLAKKLESIGIEPLIAHPKDWEVWVSQDVQLPKKFQFTSLRKSINYELRPFLKSLNSELALYGSINISAPGGLRWKKGIYEGPFILQPDAYGTWTFLESLSLERYLQGVVPHEIGLNSPLVALQAQAVLARTWALANMHRFKLDGYHLCSDTQCQVYKDPSQVNIRVKSAIKKTAGKVLSWQKKPINAFYHASNGGVIANNSEAWLVDSMPYLQSKLDAPSNIKNKFRLPLKNNLEVLNLLSETKDFYGTDHSLFRWTRVFKTNDLSRVLKIPTNDKTIKIKVLERGKSGRVLALEILSEAKNSRVILRLDRIRQTFNKLPSTLFVVENDSQGNWIFSGGGFGHGVGLSQAGAIDLARQGWTLKKILNHYYPGTKYGSVSDLRKST